MGCMGVAEHRPTLRGWGHTRDAGGSGGTQGPMLGQAGHVWRAGWALGSHSAPQHRGARDMPAWEERPELGPPLDFSFCNISIIEGGCGQTPLHPWAPR